MPRFVIISVVLHLLVIGAVGLAYHTPDRSEAEPQEVVLLEDAPKQVLPVVPENTASLEVRQGPEVGEATEHQVHRRDEPPSVSKNKILEEHKPRASEQLKHVSSMTRERPGSLQAPAHVKKVALETPPVMGEHPMRGEVEIASPVSTPAAAHLESDGAVLAAAKAVEKRSDFKPSRRERQLAALKQFPPRVRNAVWSNFSFASPETIVELSERERRIFHNYFVGVHESHIHPRFALTFLKQLDRRNPKDELNDRQLRMHAEFEIDGNGKVGEVRVVRPSGNPVFDAGAVSAILNASPFPKPPRAIRSWDGHVYMRWGFYRDSRKCGVFNAEPYILEKRKTTRVAVAR